jgi:hypothetical protein
MQAGPRRSRGVGVGLGVVLVLILAAFIPRVGAQTGTEGSDSGLAQAQAAGCDLSKDEVAMNVSTVDAYATPGKPIGAPTLEDAVLDGGKLLAQDGYVVSDSDLKAAAAAASTDSDQTVFLVELKGASLTVERWADDTYSVVKAVQCG